MACPVSYLIIIASHINSKTFFLTSRQVQKSSFHAFLYIADFNSNNEYKIPKSVPETS